MKLGTAQVIRADSRHLPIPDDSVDLVVTSPPYFALRSYQDGGEHYAGQIGDEPTPDEFVSSLLEVTRECVRVLKPSGSLRVNLGDKYSGSAGHAPSAAAAASSTLGGAKQQWTRPGSSDVATRRGPAPVGTKRTGIPHKSLMGLPWRYALRCIDDLGLILRAEVIWSKPNGLPESVTDRVRREIARLEREVEPLFMGPPLSTRFGSRTSTHDALTRIRTSDYNGPMSGAMNGAGNPLGKLPGSVWTIPTEPLRVPEHLGVDHFAAFPTQWPLRIIKAWCPQGLWTCKCGQKELLAVTSCACCGRGRGDAPVSQGVVLDPFGGTGTTAMVAKALGRHGISVDMSADYCRLAEWRTNNRDQLAKVLGIAKVEQQPDDQLSIFDLGEPA